MNYFKNVVLILLTSLFYQPSLAQTRQEYKHRIVLGYKNTYTVIHTNTDKKCSQMEGNASVYFVDGETVLKDNLKDHFEKVEFLTTEEFIEKYPGEHQGFVQAYKDQSQKVLEQDYPTGEFTDPRDQNVYKWVQIGDQIWMAENLRYFNNLGNPGDKYGYWIYDFNGNDRQQAKKDDNYLKYGVLYNYESAMKRCPDGWHLPNRKEWEVLIQNVNGEANFVKDTLFWKNVNHPKNTNHTGLSIRPSGKYQCSSFRNQSYQALFWSADIYQQIKTIKGSYLRDIYTFSLKSDMDEIERLIYQEQNAASVRCVKDAK